MGFCEDAQRKSQISAKVGSAARMTAIAMASHPLVFIPDLSTDGSTLTIPDPIAQSSEITWPM
jgi:hypothetical protein